ncbi:MAG: hypothetical protein IPK34_00020 [Ramlibacter sp.]|nr:hypothetical protein [Ramlibacter sp.]
MIVQNNRTLTASSGTTYIETGAAGTFNTSGIITNNNTGKSIDIVADDYVMSGGSRIRGGADTIVSLRPVTNGRLYQIGNDSVSGPANLTATELNTIVFEDTVNANNKVGTLVIGQNVNFNPSADGVYAGYIEVGGVGIGSQNVPLRANVDLRMYATGDIAVIGKTLSAGNVWADSATGNIVFDTLGATGGALQATGTGTMGNVTLTAFNGALVSAAGSSTPEVISGGLADDIIVLRAANGIGAVGAGTNQTPDNPIETQSLLLDAENTTANGLYLRNKGTVFLTQNTTTGSRIVNGAAGGAIYGEAYASASGNYQYGDFILAGPGSGGAVILGTGAADITVKAARDVVFAQGDKTTDVIGIDTGNAVVTVRAGRDIVGNLANRDTGVLPTINGGGTLVQGVNANGDLNSMTDIRSTRVGAVAIDLEAARTIGAPPDNCTVTCAPIEFDLTANAAVASSGWLRVVTTGVAPDGDIAVRAVGDLYTSQFSTLGTDKTTQQSVFVGAAGNLTVDDTSNFLGGGAPLPNINGDALVLQSGVDLVIATTMSNPTGGLSFQAGRDVVQVTNTNNGHTGYIEADVLGVNAGRHIMLDQFDNKAHTIAMAGGQSGAFGGTGDVNFRNAYEGDWFIGNAPGYCGFDWTTGVKATNGTITLNSVYGTAHTVSQLYADVGAAKTFGAWTDDTLPGIARFAVVSTNGGLQVLGAKASYDLSLSSDKFIPTTAEVAIPYSYTLGTAPAGNSITTLAADIGGALTFRNVAAQTTDSKGNAITPIGSADGSFTVGTVTNTDTATAFGGAGVNYPIGPAPFTPANLKVAAATTTNGVTAGDNIQLLTDRSANADVTVAKNITHTGTIAGGKIEIQATRDIIVNGGVTVSATGEAQNISFYSNVDGTTDGRIRIGDGVTLASVDSNGGNILLAGGDKTGSGFAEGRVGAVEGVLISKADVSSQDGNITVRGRGFDTAGSATDNNHGVSVNAGSVVDTTEGNLTVTGIGGGDNTNAGSDSNYGVVVDGAGTQIIAGSAGTGVGVIVGTGGSATGQNNVGIVVSGGAAVTSEGASLNMTGQGSGAGLVAVNGYGVHVSGVGSLVTTTEGGDLNITGLGGANTKGGNMGLLLEAGLISSTGTGGDITISGIAGGIAATAGDTNVGVWIRSDGSINAAGGNLVLSGVGGLSNGTDQTGVRLGEFGNKSGQITASGTYDITIRGTGGTGTGIDYRGVDLQNGSLIQNDSAAGKIDVTGIGGANTSGGFNVGVAVGANSVASTIRATSGSQVTLTGTGGGGGGSSYGVWVLGGAVVESTGTGDVLVSGLGGTGSAGGNMGVHVGSAATTSYIRTTGGGNVTVEGTGGTAGTGNTGVLINYGQVGNTANVGGGNGAVTVTGQSGSGAGSDGVAVSTLGSIVSTNTNAAGGAVNVTGVSTSVAGANNHGVYVLVGGVITADATALAVTGTGGAGTDTNVGVQVSGNGIVGTTSGDLDVTGVGRGSGTGNSGIQVDTAGAITSGGTTATNVLTGLGSTTGTSLNPGIWIVNTGSVITLAGPATVSGVGGGSTSYNTGVMVTDSGALTLQNRNSQVTGLGGGGGAGSHNHGVYVAGAGTISFTNANGGAGTPVLTGLGGAGTGGQNDGVRIGGNDGFLGNQGGTLTVAGAGGLNVLGTGGAGAGSDGVEFNVLSAAGAGTRVDNTGTGTLSVSGIGGSTTGFGIRIADDSATAGKAPTVTTSGGGSITLTGVGTGTGGATSMGVGVTGSNTVIQNTANAGVISITGTGSTAGAGGTSYYGVYVDNATIRDTNGTGGGISITGVGGGNATADVTRGVMISGGTVSTAGTGGIAITGTGGTGLSENIGVDIVGTVGQVGLVAATGDGNITITGSGGNASTNYNYGVAVRDLTGKSGTVSVANGSLLISGVGSGAANGVGVFIGDYFGGAGTTEALVQATGNANTVVIRGTGAAGTGSSNLGIVVNAGADIIVAKHSLAMTGSGGNASTGSNNHGIQIDGAGTTIQQTAAGTAANISITGQSFSGGDSEGVYVSGTAQITSASALGAGASGQIQITGTAINTAASEGFVLWNSTISSADANLFATGTGTFATANGVWINAGTIASTNGSICLSGSSGSTAAASINILGNGTLIQTTAGAHISLFADLNKGGIDINSSGGTTLINAPLGTVTLTAPWVDEMSGSTITADKLALKGKGEFDLDQATNNVNQIAADIVNGDDFVSGTGTNSGIARLTYRDADGFTITSVASCSSCAPNVFNTTAIDGIVVGASGQGVGSDLNAVTLKANGDVQQDQRVVTSKLELLGMGDNANFFLASSLAAGGGGANQDTSAFTTNDVDVVVGNVTSNTATTKGIVQYRDANGFTISSISGGLSDSTLGLSASGKIALLADVGADNGVVAPDIWVGDGTIASYIRKTGGTASKTSDTTLLLRANRDIHIVNNGTNSSDIYVDTGTVTTGKLDVTLNSDYNQDTKQAYQTGAAALGGRVRVIGLSTDEATIATNGGFLTIGGDTNALTDNAWGRGGDSTPDTTQDDGVAIHYGSVSTVGGAITIHGAGDLTDNAVGRHYGVHILNSTINSANGNVLIQGTGGGAAGNALADAGRNAGVFMTGSYMSTATGTINITGTGGNNADDRNNGVSVQESTIVSSTGAQTYQGTGRGTGTTNRGVQLIDADVRSTGSTIAITGTGSQTGTGNQNMGVIVTESNLTKFSTTLTAGTGLTITGTGGTGVDQNYGVRIGSAIVGVTGTGDLFITGQGYDGAGTVTGDKNSGVSIGAAKDQTNTNTSSVSPTVFTADGNLWITGIATAEAASDENRGVEIDRAFVINTSTGAGNTLVIVGTGGQGSLDGTNRGVQVTGSVISSAASTQATDVFITGKGGSGTGANNDGVVVNISTTVLGGEIAPVVTVASVTSGSGAIFITGDSGSGSVSRGVLISGDNSTLATPPASIYSSVASVSGDITIEGTSNGTLANNNRGVQIQNSRVETGNANIGISGAASAGAAVTFGNTGVQIMGSLVQSTGDNTKVLEITGTGGASATQYSNLGVNILSSTVSTDSAALTITGLAGKGTDAGANKANSAGVNLSNYNYDFNGNPTTVGKTVATVVRSTGAAGAGAVNVYGVALNTSAGDFNDGVRIIGARVESDGANILVDGQAGSGANSNRGVTLQRAFNVDGGGTNVDAWITAGTAGDTGNVEVYGNPVGGQTVTGANNHGVETNNATISAAAGSVHVTGVAGTGTSNNDGVTAYNFSTISVGSAGLTLQISGFGNGTAGSNDGVSILSDSLVQSAATDKKQATTIYGQGGDTATGDATDNNGIWVNDSTVRVTAGKLFMTGFGGDGLTGDNNLGVIIENGTLVESINDSAKITIRGEGGTAPGGSNAGVYVGGNNGTRDSVINSQAGARIEITGSGGTGGAGNTNVGVMIDTFGRVTTSTVATNAASQGRVTISGFGGDGTGSHGVQMNADSTVSSANTNTAADKIDISGTGGTGKDSHGVFLNGTGPLATQQVHISSEMANVFISGIGGSANLDDNSDGVYGTFALITTNGAFGGAAEGNIRIVGAANVATGGGDGIELVDTIVEAKGAGAGGAVTLLGTGEGTRQANGRGVVLTRTDVDTIDNQILIVGTASQDATTNGGMSGVVVQDSSDIKADTAGGAGGFVRVTGFGGVNADGDANYGVLMDNKATVTAMGKTSGADGVYVTGLGGGIGAGSDNNAGVRVSDNSSITADVHDVRILGVGGQDGLNNDGVQFEDTVTVSTTTGGDVYITGTANGSGGNSDGVSLTNSVSVTADGGDADQANIQITGYGANGAGAANRGVYVTTSSSISTTSGTEKAGSIIISGTGGTGTTNQDGVMVTTNSTVSVGGKGTTAGLYIEGAAGVGSGGSSDGVIITDSSTVSSVSDGTDSGFAIHITGTAAAVTGGSDNTGVTVSNTSKVLATHVDATADVYVFGQGGTNADGTGNHGVLVDDNGAAAATDDSTVSTVGGSLVVSGIAGGTGATSAFNAGVAVLDSTLAAGTGNVLVLGTGGAGDLGTNIGVAISGVTGLVTGGGATVDITGTGMGNGDDNIGVAIVDTAKVTATKAGASTLTISGQGSTDATGESNHGVFISGTNTSVLSAQGQINITGNGGATKAASGNLNTGVTIVGTDTSNRATVAVQGGSLASSITITGNGGGNTSSFNGGVDVTFANVTNASTNAAANIVVTGLANAAKTLVDSNSGVYVSNGTVTTAGGDITISGTGAGTGSYNSGVEIIASGVNVSIVKAADSVLIDGNGSAPATGEKNYGVRVQGNGTTVQSGKDMVITGDAGATTGVIALAKGDNTGVLFEGTASTKNVQVLAGTTLDVTGNGGRATAGNSDGVRAVDAVINAGGNYNVIGTAFNDANVTGGGNDGVSYTRVSSTITAGNVVIDGTASQTAADTGDNNNGVVLVDKTSVANTGTGTVTIEGTGAAAALGSFNHGVFVSNTANTLGAMGVTDGNDSTVSSNSGNLSITGFAGGTGAASAFNVGVGVANSTVDSASGNVLVTGLGGKGDLGSNIGVALSGATARINGGGSTLAISGTAQGNGDDNIGVAIISTSQVNADKAGASTLTISGQGSTDATGESNHGVFISGTNTSVLSAQGQINITGNGGATKAASGNLNTGVTIVGTDTSNRATVAVQGGSLASSITITGNGGGNTSSFNGGVDVTFANVTNASTNAAANIVVTGLANAAKTLVDSNSGVYVSNGTVTTAGGDITISGTGAGTGSYNSGVDVNKASTVGTAAGAIHITGVASQAATGADNVGVRIADALTRVRTATGSIDITGSGGAAAAASGSGNIGVMITGTTAAQADQAFVEVTGNAASTITVVGTGGGNGAASDKNLGVMVFYGSVTNASTNPGAAINVTGVGNGLGAGDDTANDSNIGIGIASGTISANGGNIGLTGTANGLNNDNAGVILFNETDANATRVTTTSGNVTITGIGSFNATGEFNNGVVIEGRGNLVSTATGGITISGYGGAYNNGTSSDNNQGVLIIGKANTAGDAVTVSVTGAGKAIVITGLGGGDGSSSNSGVDATYARITSSSATAGIAITGLADDNNVGTLDSSNYGVRIDNSVVSSANATSDAIFVTGSGAGTGDNSSGVRLSSSTLTSSGGNDLATIQVHGVGAPGDANNRGVEVTASTITSAQGYVWLSGSANGSGANNDGVLVDNSRIALNGGAGNTGVYIDGNSLGGTTDGNGVRIANSTLTSAGNDGFEAIYLSGSASGTGAGNHGISTVGSTLTTSGGSGADRIYIEGYGSNGVAANVGVRLDSSSLTTNGGHFEISGTATASDPGAFGILVTNNTTLASTSGDICLIGEVPSTATPTAAIALQTGTNIIQTTSGQVALKAVNGGIDLGLAAGGDTAIIRGSSTTSEAAVSLISDNGVNQYTGSIAAGGTGGGLLLSGSGAFYLESSANNLTNLAVSIANNGTTGIDATLLLTETDGFTISKLDACTTCTTLTVDGVTVGSAGGGSVATPSANLTMFNVASGTVSQAAGSNVVTSGLQLQGGAVYSLLSNAANNVDVLTATLSGSGTVTYQDSDSVTVGDFMVTGVLPGGSSYSSKGITTVNQNIAVQAANSIYIDAPVDVGTANAGFQAATLIRQNATGGITAGGLQLRGGADVYLAAGTNDVDTIAANQVGNLHFIDADGFAVGTVATQLNSGADTVGINATGDVYLTSTTATNTDIVAVSNAITSAAGKVVAINAGAGSLTIATTITAGGDLWLSAGKAITESGASAAVTANSGTGSLVLLGGADVDMRSTGNRVATLAAGTAGTPMAGVCYVDADGLVIGSVNTAQFLSGANGAEPFDGTFTAAGAVNGITSASHVFIQANPVTVTQNITANFGVPAGTSDIVIDAQGGNLTLDNVIVAAGKGDIGLWSTGTVQQINGGALTGEGLQLSRGGAFDLQSAGNAMATLSVAGANASVPSGSNVAVTDVGATSVAFVNSLGVEIGYVYTECCTLTPTKHATAGVNVSGTVAIDAAGNITGSDATNSVIKASILELVTTGDVALNTAANTVGTLAVNAGGTSVAFGNTGALVIGSGATFTTDGITTGAGGEVVLNVNGALTQGTNGSIVTGAGGLLLQGTGSAVIDHASNDIANYAADKPSGNVTIVDANGINAGTVAGKSGIQIGTGDLVLDAKTMDITQSAGAAIVSDDFTATTTGKIILNEANDVNTFTAAGGSASVDFTDADAVSLGNVTTNGPVTITAGGNVSQTGVITTTAGNLKVVSTGGDIMLAGNNNVDGTVIVDAVNGNVTFNETGDLVLNASNTAGEFSRGKVMTLTSASGNITDDQDAVQDEIIAEGSTSITLISTTGVIFTEKAAAPFTGFNTPQVNAFAGGKGNPAMVNDAPGASIDIYGAVTSNTINVLGTPPGTVWLNGQKLFPAENLGAVTAALQTHLNSTGEINMLPPLSVPDLQSDKDNLTGAVRELLDNVPAPAAGTDPTGIVIRNGGQRLPAGVPAMIPAFELQPGGAPMNLPNGTVAAMAANGDVVITLPPGSSLFNGGVGSGGGAGGTTLASAGGLTAVTITPAGIVTGRDASGFPVSVDGGIAGNPALQSLLDQIADFLPDEYRKKWGLRAKRAGQDNGTKLSQL